ncbi:hypothetical protein GIB67_015290, partial [Kingdonia uniflora]
STKVVKTRSQSSQEAASRRIKQLYDELVMRYFGSVNLNDLPLPPRGASYEGMCEAEAALWREDFHLHFILTMEDSVDENWSKVIGEESPERCENEHIVDPFSAEAPYEGQHFNIAEDVRLWYEQYGRGQGFSTKIRNSTKRPRLDDIDRAYFCCMSNGFSKKNLGNPESSDVAGNRRSSDNGRAESFELQIDLEKLTSNCGCKLFEYIGPPCCQLLKVFSKYDNLKIPKAFIMIRWTIGANKFSRSYNESQLEGDNLRHALRHSHLSLRVSNLFERALKMKESFDFAVLKLDELESYLKNYDDALTQIDASQQNISTPVTDSLVFRTMILNPLVVQTKGRAKIDHNKGVRWKEGMEEAVMKKKRTCKSCRVLSNHDKRICPLLKTMIAESRDNNNGESIQSLHSNSNKYDI